MIKEVRCDRCSRHFDFRAAAFTRRAAEDPEVEESGFTCPHCGHATVAVRVNSHIRHLQEAVRKGRERSYKKIRAGVAPNQAERRLRRAMEELRKALDQFNGGPPTGRSG